MQSYKPITAVNSSNSSDGGKKQGQPSRRKRCQVFVACNSCQKKKVACDGKRPACTRCTKNQSACTYVSASASETRTMALKRQVDNLQQKLKDHTEILELIRLMSDSEAVEVIRKLRTTSNASMILSSIKGSAHGAVRPSDNKTARAILPPTESNIEFELTMLHHSVYPALEPLDIGSIDFDNLFPRSPRKSSIMLPSEPLVPIGSGLATEETSTSPVITTAPPSPLRGFRSRHTSPVAGPVQDRQYCDSRLNRLNMGYWTRIPIGDEFAACVLSNYFESYHPIFACFDPDLFLSDLVDQKLNYCSPVLVSALMSIACQSYNAFDVRSSAFSVAFMQETERLLQAERNSDTPATLAAMCYLCMAGVMGGKDNLASQLAAECRAMAVRMGLFGARPTDDLVMAFYELSPEKIKEFAHAAWGTYAWLTYRNAYFPDKPIEFPPVLPIPGDVSRKTNSSMFLWPPHTLPIYMGQTFPTLSKLWVIIQEIESVYTLTDSTPLVDRVSLAFAESKYQKLLAWADTILPQMLRGEHNSSHTLFFHGLYHCTVLSIFRPFLDSSEQLRLRSFSSVDGTPSSAFYASLNQLKRLIYTYRAQSPHLLYNGWFNAALIQVSYAVLKDRVHNPHWQFYFRLCFCFWKELYVQYRVFYPIVQATLAFALQSGAIDTATATALIEELRTVGHHHEAPEGALTSAVLDFGLAMKNLQEAKMDCLAQQFEDFLLFDEFTTTNFEMIA